MDRNMINIVKKEIFLSADYNCKFCNDTGKIKIYRDDWEDYEELICEYCKSDWKYFLKRILYQFNSILIWKLYQKLVVSYLL